MSHFARDFKAALRALALRPVFSFVVVGILALGIAGNVTIFTIYSGLFLRPLPMPQPDRLVDLDETAPKWNLRFVSIAKPDFDAWREHNHSFDSMAAFDEENFNFSGHGAPQRLKAARVTVDALRVLQVDPLLGRAFLDTEDRFGGARVVMLSDTLWRGQFNADPAILGQILKLDGQPYTVVGVLPPRAHLSISADIWVPLAANRNDREGWCLKGIGRLKPGVTVEQARADLMRIHRGLITVGRKDNATTTPTVLPLRDRFLGSLRPAGNMLLAAAGVVLLIACANVAGLMMMRAAGRAREIAIRAALGASRAAVVRQLLSEGVFYAALGGAAGFLLATGVLRFLTASAPALPIPWLDFSLDYRALLFSLGITALAAILFGLAPALHGSRVDLRAALHESARSSSTRSRRFALQCLVTAQIGLAVLLLTTATLLAFALRHVMSVEPGFRPQGVLTFRVALTEASYPERAHLVNFFERLVDRLRAVPGVATASAVTLPPLTGHWGQFFVAEGAPPLAAGEQNPAVLQVLATPGYLDTVGISLVAGRQFTERDGTGESRVAIVSESFAKRFLPNVDPIGRRIRYAWRPGHWTEIVGVTRDVKHYGLDQESRPAVFIPYRQWPVPVMTMVLRGAANAGSLVAPAREALRQLDPDLPMFEVTSLTETVDRSLWTRRFYSSVALAFAAVAVLLAAAGIYGVISYAVSERTRELGIRIALGATSTQVMQHVFRQGLAMLLIGVPAGLAAMFALSGLLRSLLFDVPARAPLAYVVAALFVAGIAFFANWIPACRAAQITPVEALRSE